MNYSIQELRSQLTNGEKISNEKLCTIKGGGTGTITDPRRVEATVITVVSSLL